ncbi:MAG: DsbA family protein [Rhizobiaceae bacterium]|nr:DsbA family protein [Rhizobiaceae bacterium]MCV0408616.1 DsbA family protein [Rhizobiaceae bacterium]
MTRNLIIGAVAIAVSAAMLAGGFLAGSRQPPTSTAASIPTDRAQVERIVRDYLVANPEIMLEVQTALESRQQERQREDQRATIDAASDDIFNASYDGVIGNPEGSLTVVEFFDYNCGYCKRALSDMETMVESNPDLRFVLKEFPILGPDSQEAHVVSMAFRALSPENYAEFHRRLLGGEGRAGEARAMEIALSFGVEEEALRAEMQNPEIMQAFARTYELADSLAITGTPSYVVGDEVVFGALGVEVLGEKLANVRECQSASC